VTDFPHDPAFDDDFQAAELALGLAEGDALATGRVRVRDDQAFAARVAGWQERFVAMTDDIDPVAPNRGAKKALLAQLFPKARTRLLDRLWVWKAISLASVLAVAYMAMPMLRPPPPGAPAELYATQMKGDTSDLVLLAVVDRTRGDVALRRVSGGAPDGRVLELWAIMPERAPISLGVLPDGDVTRVVLPADLMGDVAKMTLAISDEPPGGAPEGSPTGSIMAVGAIEAL